MDERAIQDAVKHLQVITPQHSKETIEAAIIAANGNITDAMNRLLDDSKNDDVGHSTPRPSLAPEAIPSTSALDPIVNLMRNSRYRTFLSDWRVEDQKPNSENPNDSDAESGVPVFAGNGYDAFPPSFSMDSTVYRTDPTRPQIDYSMLRDLHINESSPTQYLQDEYAPSSSGILRPQPLKCDPQSAENAFRKQYALSSSNSDEPTAETNSLDDEVRAINRLECDETEHSTEDSEHESTNTESDSPELVHLNEEDEYGEVEEPEIPDMQTMEPQLEEPSDQFEIQLKVVIPVGAHSAEYMEQYIDNVLRATPLNKPENCVVHSYTIVRQSTLPRADYEKQAYEWIVNVVLKEDNSRSWRDTLNRFVEYFCYFSSGALHDAIRMEIPDFTRVFKEIRPQHKQIPISAIGFGNCPNLGLFFVRGDYVSYKNAISNHMMNQSNQYGRRKYQRDEPQKEFYAAGKCSILSYAHFEHDRRYMNVFFAVKMPPQPDGLAYSGYKLAIPYNAMVQIVVDTTDRFDNCLYFRLKHPPQVWQAVPKQQNYHNAQRRWMNMEQTKEWVRVLQIAGCAESRYVGCSREALADCQWLRLSFRKRDADDSEDTTLDFMSIVARLMRRSHARIYFGSMMTMRRRLPTVPEIASIGSFRADYALRALISRGSTVTDQLFDFVDENAEATERSVHPFFKVLERSMQECQAACEEALEQILCAIDERRSVEILSAFDVIYHTRVETYRRLNEGESVKDHEMRRTLPKNCVLVRKVMVTPLRILFMAPEVMMTNRIVRHFGAENALRCVFRDDSGGKINWKDFVTGSNSDQQSTIISEMVQRTLSHGVEICGRGYHFLAWSNSQMRDHGCYMYSPGVDPRTNEPFTIEQMRTWMGDFSSSKNVPKLMSRMGQCFTQAQPTVKLSAEDYCVTTDIEGGAGHGDTGEKFCFSDGCGRISARLARKIAVKLDLDIIPSCFQVRFKGFKGVLAIDPALDYTPGACQIVFRKSQEKFKDSADDEKVLEVVKYAMPSPVCLNRPMITILDQVAEKQNREAHRKLCRKVHYYLEKELSRLGAMLLDEKIAAEELTQRINLPVDYQYMRQCGVTFTNEPFMRRLLVAVYRYTIQNNLSKAKIFLPANMGRSMYGIVDETGLLQYGQVFIQYSPSIRTASAHPILHLGPVLITKNPCHVAGDVRMFEAVYQPALQHLFDVVVFPQHGPRPHPDEMAGSDLDGDEYSVIFDPDIAFPHNEEPMTFPKSTPEESDSALSTEDMVDFFLKYLRQDSIGRMSNAHLIMADVKGLFHPDCDNIARKCSVAVDFPKSGEPAEPLTKTEQSTENPDYMFSGFKPMYRSKRLNGQLYRKAKKVEEVLELTERLESLFVKSIDDVICPEDGDLFAGERGATEKRRARKLHDEYCGRMQQLLDEYSITDEASVVSGHIVSLKRLTAMERDDYSFYHTDKIVELRYARIFHHFRNEFFADFGGEEKFLETDSHTGRKYVQTTPEMEKRARQWYYIAYVDEPRGKRAISHRSMLSFPWIVWDVLSAYRRNAMLASSFTSRPPLSQSPVADRLTLAVQEEVHKRHAEFDEFRHEILAGRGGSRMADTVARYAEVYSNGLLYPLFVLSNWTEKEKLFAFSNMSMYHVAVLFIQFSLGILHSAIGVADTTYPVITFPELLPYVEDGGRLPDEYYSLKATEEAGPALIGFLRYLGSQRFALSRVITFFIDDGDERSAPVMTRARSWMPLSQLAFRAYHYMAVSGRFDMLCVGEVSVDRIETESREPIIVASSLVATAYHENPLRQEVVLEMLRRWTGVSQILMRSLNQGRRNEVLMVTAIGTVAARQRLARLLLIPVDKLRKAIRDEIVPSEVRDETL